MITRCIWGEESVRLGNLRIASGLYVDEVVLLALSVHDILHALGQFAAESEA